MEITDNSPKTSYPLNFKCIYYDNCYLGELLFFWLKKQIFDSEMYKWWEGSLINKNRHLYILGPQFVKNSSFIPLVSRVKINLIFSKIYKK